MKTAMNEILGTLEKATTRTKSFEEMSKHEVNLFAHKLGLKRIIETGGITDVGKAEKWIELIETICEWNASPLKFEDVGEFYHHLLIFDDGKTVIASVGENYEDEFHIDFVDGELLLEEKKLEEVFGSDLPGESDSINTLMNLIEFDLVINCN